RAGPGRADEAAGADRRGGDRAPGRVALGGGARSEAGGGGGDGVDGGEQGGERADELDVGVELSGGATAFELARTGARDADAVAGGVEVGAEGAFEEEAVVVEFAAVAAAGDEAKMRGGDAEVDDVAWAPPATARAGSGTSTRGAGTASGGSGTRRSRAGHAGGSRGA